MCENIIDKDGFLISIDVKKEQHQCWYCKDNHGSIIHPYDEDPYIEPDEALWWCKKCFDQVQKLKCYSCGKKAEIYDNCDEPMCQDCWICIMCICSKCDTMYRYDQSPECSCDEDSESCDEDSDDM